MKKNRVARVALGVSAGIILLLGVIWLLTRTLGDNPQRLVAGKPILSWRDELNSRDPATSNAAFAVVNTQIVPQLTDIMFHDTNDSRLRLLLVDTLSELPGVQIYFTQAGGRRAAAAQMVGAFGPAAKSAVPALAEALKGHDQIVKGPAIQALGDIHSDPQVVVPLLLGYLDDEELNDEAARALANYGSFAQAAVPKIIPLLHSSDKSAKAAAEFALKKIDPDAYAKATQSGPGGATNGSSIPVR